MSIESYYSDIDVDLVYALTGREGPDVERRVEYTYIPDQTDEDHQESARVEIHAVRIIRQLDADRYKQTDVADLLTDEEIATIEAETLKYHERCHVRVRRLREEA